MTSITALDREVIVLQAVLESIQSMVNREMLNFSHSLVGTQAAFRSPTRRALFNVLFADLLEPVDAQLIGANGSLLDYLETVARFPELCAQSAATDLNASVRRLRQWLETEIEVNVWFPTIDTEIKLRLLRREFVSICGNISKHNVSRLTRKAAALAKLLLRNGVNIAFFDSLRALDDFHARFHDDIFSYHSTTMAELLNNVRWGMHAYLEPEFHRAYIAPPSDTDPRYSFDVPRNLTNIFAQDRYWDLMNSVRAKPWIDRFTASPSLAESY